MSAWNSASGAGFIAFWLFGQGEFFGPCSGNEDIHVSNSMGLCNAVACYEPTGYDTGLFTTRAQIRVNNGYLYTRGGAASVLAHELGHALGLAEQYIHGSYDCNGSVTSVMESTTLFMGRVVSQCGVVAPQPFDSGNVQSFFSQSFGSPPSPQLIWAFPLNDVDHRVVFKVPDAASHQYERGLCPGGYWVSQPVTTINTDVMYADAPLPSGLNLCSLYRHSGGPGTSIGLQLGESTQGSRRVTGMWSSLFSASTAGVSTQFNVMRNEYSASIADSWMTNTANFPLPQCPFARLGGNTSRACLDKTILGTVVRFKWQPVSGGPFYYLEVP